MGNSSFMLDYEIVFVLKIYFRAKVRYLLVRAIFLIFTHNCIQSALNRIVEVKMGFGLFGSDMRKLIQDVWMSVRLFLAVFCREAAALEVQIFR